VIWRDHVQEMTDLSWEDRALFMQVVWQVEHVVRVVMQPDKVNLASLGNMTPHLHWHVIPRYVDDVHFPHPVWAQAQRPPTPSALAARRALLPVLRDSIIETMHRFVAT